jgi:hypothetical protein
MQFKQMTKRVHLWILNCCFLSAFQFVQTIWFYLISIQPKNVTTFFMKSFLGQYTYERDFKISFNYFEFFFEILFCTFIFIHLFTNKFQISRNFQLMQVLVTTSLKYIENNSSKLLLMLFFSFSFANKLRTFCWKTTIECFQHLNISRLTNKENKYLFIWQQSFTTFVYWF